MNDTELPPWQSPGERRGRSGIVELVRWAASLLSLGAAGLHFAVSPGHFQEYWLFGWFFLVSAWLQSLWAVLAVYAPRRWVLLAGIAGNLLLLSIWGWTRFVSVPLGPAAGEPEPFGVVDETAAVFEVYVVLMTAWLLLVGRSSKRQAGRSSRAMIAGVVAIAFAVVGTSGLALAVEAMEAARPGFEGHIQVGYTGSP